MLATYPANHSAAVKGGVNPLHAHDARCVMGVTLFETRMLYVAKCELDRWLIQTWPRDNPDNITDIPFRCRSWRHTGECAQWRAKSDYARIVEGMSKHEHWSHVVLTYHNWDGRELTQLWRQSLSNWAKLRKRLKREYKDYKYIQTWEVTRKGCPHCHMAIASPHIQGLAERIPQHLDILARKAIGQRNFDTILGHHATDCGFGPKGFIEPIWGQEGFVLYLEKLKRELTMSASKSQSPLEAPRHFRRMRASVGLIPPPHKDESLTGHLLDRAGEILTRKKAVTL